jgi:hypothetical protein
MQQKSAEGGHEKICFPELPLAMYREIAAHLRQVGGVEIAEIPQQSQQFSYKQSQIEGLWIQYAADGDASSKQRIEEILEYYAQQYGCWQRESLDSSRSGG